MAAPVERVMESCPPTSHMCCCVQTVQYPVHLHTIREHSLVMLDIVLVLDPNWPRPP